MECDQSDRIERCFGKVSAVIFVFRVSMDHGNSLQDSDSEQVSNVLVTGFGVRLLRI
jgi:hypothetical protein